jgi:molybdopterin molybdotransferase
MLSVTEARAHLIASFAPGASEVVAIANARGRALAEPLCATRDQPPFAAAAMDGYAFQSSEAPQAYAIVGESAAGHAYARVLSTHEAVRISTGAPLPMGADAVLIQEDAVRDGDRLINAYAPKNQHIRPRGGDFAAGERLLTPGRRLDPIALALAASTGCDTLSVVRQPRITVIASGDEVVTPGQAARPDQVYESGSFAICGLIEAWGGVATRGPILLDSMDVITKAAEAALAQSDLLVLIGGASVGPHDHARPALERLGVRVQFDKVAVRPGKPTWFGASQHGKVLGLPGNPASAIVCAMLFLKPIIDVMLVGQPSARPLTRRAPLAHPLAANGPRESYLRSALNEDGRLKVFDDQDSSLLSVFSKSNALALRAAKAPPCATGDETEYLPLEL